MSNEPTTKRAVAFIDGQNLFYGAKAAFGYSFPNYDPKALAGAVCKARGFQLSAVRFYTGIPDAADNAFWNHFWVAKLAALGTRAIYTFSRPLRYRNQTVAVTGGKAVTVLVGQEKGIDIRIALDVVHLARENQYDVGIIFSQDQDLSEAVSEVKGIALDHKRWIKLVSAFPASPTASNRRGINNTDWCKIDRAMYDACIDPNDYRPKKT